MVATCLKDIKKTNQVAINISFWVLDGVANARLCRQVYYDIETVLSKQAFNQRGIAQVTAYERESIVSIGLLQHAKARLLDSGVVIAVHVI